MIDQLEISHHIQKHILSVLMHRGSARFRDLRPLKTDTNLFAYHLKLMTKNRVVEKTDGGYKLAPKGLAYVDRVNADKLFVRNQPKIITMLVIQNSEGDVLLLRRDKQPYIDRWTLPYGKLHIDDTSAKMAAQREAYEKLGLKDQKMRHVGDCYIRVKSDGRILSSTLAHVFTFNHDDIATNERIKWFRPHKLSSLDLAPAVESIMSRTFFNDPYFFEEFEESI
ncbi:MAG TPA: NUDIX hydrolase [Candidatus Saccharimonadales bacterium]|nr:NUDIX hydrolase [Candidatus Saccharimonadales bacterium]